MRKLLAAALLLLCSTPALATVVQPLSDREMVTRADAVIYGVVLGIEMRRTPKGRVYTNVAVQVIRALKGVKMGEIIDVKLPGGKDGDVVTTVAGAPRPKVGEQIVGFLEPGTGGRIPMGLSFGWLEVRDVGGEKRVFRDIGGIMLADKQQLNPASYIVAGEPLETYLTRLQGFTRPPESLSQEVVP